jgi:pyruvate dehydrogenase E1 component
MSDKDIDGLRRGGHDFRKLYAAFLAAKSHVGQPTVILAKTKKGYGMGGAGESRMTAHQAKKLDFDALKAFRDRFSLPLSDLEVEALHFLKPSQDSAEMRYVRDRRKALGGAIPSRITKSAESLTVPSVESYAKFAREANGKEMSTTMAFARMLSGLLKDASIGQRVVPIVADEARTFGMANLFRQIGIYSPEGQLYEPEDAGSMLAYREAKDGQLLEEGITEAGALSSWVAAATSYSVHGKSMLPFYIYYSIFGFQRVGDLIWAAADQRARGFLLGATSGRTTLSGEGLQHQDGSSHVMAAMVPNCRSYDPAFAGELAVILDHGMRRMLEEQVDEFYYITLMNENYAQPSIPEGIDEQIVQGMYCYRNEVCEGEGTVPSVRLLGSGAIFREVEAAAQLLKTDWGVSAEVWSVTSFSELAKQAREVDRWNRLNPEAAVRESYVSKCLSGGAPVIAATDYVRAWPQLISEYVNARFISLGTDGFGRSDTRTALRDFFEVSRHHIVLAAIDGLVHDGVLPRSLLGEVISKYKIQQARGPSWLN